MPLLAVKGGRRTVSAASITSECHRALLRLLCVCTYGSGDQDAKVGKCRRPDRDKGMVNCFGVKASREITGCADQRSMTRLKGMVS